LVTSSGFVKHSVLFLLVAAGCVADRTPVPPAGGTPTVEPAVEPVVDASVPVQEPTDAASSTEGAVDAAVVAVSDARAPDAKVEAPPPPPLVVKGARKCSEEEASNEVCFEGRVAGSCDEGLCITPNLCPRYCAALGSA
jgi:hypothetical protein